MHTMVPATTKLSPPLNVTPSSRKIFPFFDLARELRDMIYDECLDNRKRALSCCLRLKLSLVATSTLLTVSRQFRQEYHNRETKLAELELSDHMFFSETRLELPSRLTSIRSLKINLAASSTMLRSHPSGFFHARWVKDVLQQLPTLQKLSLFIKNPFRNNEDTYAGMGDVLNEGFWVNLPQLSVLQVYDVCLRPDAADEENEYDFDYPDQMVLQWSPETRKVELVDLN